MPRYVVQHGYSSWRDGVPWGRWEAGQVIDLREVDADWVNTDSPGCLAVEAQPQPADAASEADAEADDTQREATPARNRQHRGGKTRGASA
jgi:hypothetical protein